MTLGELIKDKELPVTATNKYLSGVYLITHFNSNYCLATRADKTDTFFDMNAPGWELYVEPKKTKTVYEYLVKPMGLKCSFFSEWHESDEAYKIIYPHKPIIKTGRSHTFEVQS